MIKIICNRCNKSIESIQKVGFIQFCYQNPFESVTDDNISDRNHYCEDCMTEIEQFVRNDGGKVVNKTENIEKALNDAFQEMCEMSGEININLPKIPVLVPGNVKKQETPLLREKNFKSEPRTSRYRIDYAKIMSLKESGMKNKDIAVEMGMTPQEVATAVYTYKKRNGKVAEPKRKKSEGLKKDKWVDTGKILALWNAKWGIGKIAEEMGMEESEVANILAR